MVTKTPGVGSIYLSSFRDKTGAPLDGGRAEVSSQTPGLKTNADGSVDVYVGAKWSAGPFFCPAA